MQRIFSALFSGDHAHFGTDMSAGLFVRPPHRDENFANWEKATAGLNEDSEGWVYVPPVPGVFTVFPG
jgi:isopenicillin N synthase-like dioxygenase